MMTVSKKQAILDAVTPDLVGLTWRAMEDALRDRTSLPVQTDLLRHKWPAPDGGWNKATVEVNFWDASGSRLLRTGREIDVQRDEHSCWRVVSV